MESGFAHLQRFSTREQAMNVTTSPRLLIFAAILRLIVPIDFGISILISSLLHFILTVIWILNNISFNHKNARKKNNIILTVSIQSKDRDDKGRKKAIANYSPQWPQKTMPVFSANYFSFFITGYIKIIFRK